MRISTETKIGFDRTIRSEWLDAAESVGDESGYAKLRADAVDAFGGETKIPMPVRKALAAAKARVSQVAA